MIVCTGKESKRRMGMWYRVRKVATPQDTSPASAYIMEALLNDPTTNKGWKFCG